MENRTKNQICFGDNACNATKICSKCGELTSIIKSTYKEHLWEYWGYCDKCGESQMEYKVVEE